MKIFKKLLLIITALFLMQIQNNIFAMHNKINQNTKSLFDLPENVIFKVTSYLSLHDRFNQLGKTCKEAHSFINNLENTQLLGEDFIQTLSPSKVLSVFEKALIEIKKPNINPFKFQHYKTIIKETLKRKDLLDLRDTENNTVLMIAIRYAPIIIDQQNIIDTIFDKVTKIEKESCQNILNNAISLASLNNEKNAYSLKKIIGIITESFDKDALKNALIQPAENKNILHLASSYGYPEHVAFILKTARENFDDEFFRNFLQSRDNLQNTPLHTANTPENVNLILNSAKNISNQFLQDLFDLTNQWGETPLFVAARKDFYILKTFLINLRSLGPIFTQAQLLTRCIDGNTLLHCAAGEEFNEENIKLILKTAQEVGEELNLGIFVYLLATTNNYLETALHIAVKNRNLSNIMAIYQVLGLA